MSNSPYETGADFWRDTAVNHGIEEASGICGRYLDTQLRMEQPDNERQFCRELFAAMFEDTAGTTDPAKILYPYDFQKANERTEPSCYHDSRKRNTECAGAIDDAIRASRYKPNYYNLELAAMSAIHTHGFARVMAVLARQLRHSEWDGRYSRSNKDWANGFACPEKAFVGAILNAHPTLIESFINYTRKLYTDLGAERFALPGQPESGEFVHGYEIVRAITFDNQRGFAIGLNPNAVQNFVTWQFTVENGRREFYWGAYSNELADAADNYLARVAVHMSGGDAKEIQRPVVAVEVPEPTEAELSFAAWMAVTESSRYKWVEDEIYRLNGRGAMYYTGGEDGVYMRIDKDGKLEAGDYEGAVPHIGEAMFQPAVTKEFPGFSEAYQAAREAGGKQFMVDMFSGAESQPLVSGRGVPDVSMERPSVLKQIRDAQQVPKPPRKEKAPGQRKSKSDIEI